jgi:hypothetical protein
MSWFTWMIGPEGCVTGNGGGGGGGGAGDLYPDGVRPDPRKLGPGEEKGLEKYRASEEDLCDEGSSDVLLGDSKPDFPELMYGDSNSSSDDSTGEYESSLELGLFRLPGGLDGLPPTVTVLARLLVFAEAGGLVTGGGGSILVLLQEPLSRSWSRSLEVPDLVLQSRRSLLFLSAGAHHVGCCRCWDPDLGGPEEVEDQLEEQREELQGLVDPLRDVPTVVGDVPDQVNESPPQRPFPEPESGEEDLHRCLDVLALAEVRDLHEESSPLCGHKSPPGSFQLSLREP